MNLVVSSIVTEKVWEWIRESALECSESHVRYLAEEAIRAGKHNTATLPQFLKERFGTWDNRNLKSY